MSQQAENELRAAFGANQWLVDELYEQYVADKNAVDPAWWDFFEDYRPGGDQGNGAPARGKTGDAAPAGRKTAGDAEADGATSGNAASGNATSGNAASGNAAPGNATSGGTAPASPADTVAEAPAGGAPAATTPSAPSPTPAPTEPDERPAPSAQARRSPAQATSRTPREPGADTSTTPITAVAQPATAAYAEVPESRLQHLEVAPEPTVERLRGPAARVVSNMETSLSVPTATSVRAVPAKLMVDNRIVVNNHLVRTRGGKVSFTHLIGYAVVEALAEVPAMNSGYVEVDGKPSVSTPGAVNFGLAIDLAKPDGTRQLLVPSIKGADSMDFGQFVAAYEDLVRRARTNKLTVDDFTGTTITLTNPGTIGTVHSVPRLMAGQGTIVGVGAMDYPAEFQGASDERLARLGVSKVVTLSSTYDHRIIQGAQSGEFLRIVGAKLLGEGGFYDRVFTAMRVPYEPVRWVRDNTVDAEAEQAKPARIAELIHAYRSRGHLMAETDPLAYRQRTHPDLDIQNHGLTLWDLDRVFPTAGFTGKPKAKLRDILGLLRDSYCRTIGIE